MTGDLEAVERRHRRLKRLKATKEIERANAALQDAWESGRQPAKIGVRTPLFSSDEAVPAPVTRLLNPRGIALRFYLIAVFEAHCRLAPGKQWSATRPLQGPQGWTNFVAIDAAYSSTTDTYLPETKQSRDAETSRLRQLQGALRTLEDIGTDGEQALVEVPRKANGRTRHYADFQLLRESGRGRLHTPEHYSVPTRAETTPVTEIPLDFFLHGWVHVLNPAEMVTWLALQKLSQDYPGSHEANGVYLYAKRRKEEFGLLRDSYEDSCNTLRALGLIRTVQPQVVVPVTVGPADGSGAQKPSFLFRPDRYQMLDEGLHADALEKAMKELTLRQHDLKQRRRIRTATG